MALEVGIILDLVDVSPCLVFVPLRVPTDRAPEVIKIILYSLKFLETGRYQTNILGVNQIHYKRLLLSLYYNLLWFSRQQEGCDSTTGTYDECCYY